MGARASSKRQGTKSQKLNQSSVKSVWSAYFMRRAEADRRRREAKKKRLN